MTASACWNSSRELGCSVSSDDATAKSAHLSFLAALERLPRVDSRVRAAELGRCRPTFLQRRWITEEDYLTHLMVPVLDSEQEVEVEIDHDAAVYRYRSPQQRSRTVGRTDIKGVTMIDPSDIELAAMRKCLKSFGEAAGEIGFTKPLGNYSEAEALQVIDAIVTCYTEAT